MALSYKARRRWSLIILLIGMPLYIILAIGLVAGAFHFLGRPPIWAEFMLYVVLGVIWIFPFKSVFMGIGQADPDAPEQLED
jgi:membrane-associated PAP2 superfamily phosphatase